jgi:hypothetical protein
MEPGIGSGVGPGIGKINFHSSNELMVLEKDKTPGVSTANLYREAKHKHDALTNLWKHYSNDNTTQSHQGTLKLIKKLSSEYQSDVSRLKDRLQGIVRPGNEDDLAKLAMDILNKEMKELEDESKAFFNESSRLLA